MTLTETEYGLLIEALASRASRLESYGRSNPRSAGPNDRKAEAMRSLCKKIKTCLKLDFDEKGGNC